MDNVPAPAAAQSMEIVPYQPLSNDAISQLLEDLTEDDKTTKVTDSHDAETEDKLPEVTGSGDSSLGVQCSELNSTYEYS